MNKTFDYIIVGQGLAGSCLALQLMTRNKSVLVIDKPAENKATSIAAGLFNPITGKVMSNTWQADVLFPYLKEFYKKAEQITGRKFYNSMPLYRPFISVQEQNDWMANPSEGMNHFIKKIYTEPAFINEVKNPFGGLLLDHCGFINTNEFCGAVRNILKSTESFIDEKFDSDLLEISDSFIRYKSIESGTVVFCDGVQVHHNKYFDWLPIKPLKGETLTIKPSKLPEVIFNRGVYLVPASWKVGATYSNSDLSEAITERGRQELTEKLDELVDFPYQIIHHEWGMRPTSPDRRPILGKHPKYNRLAIFNGLGTKGVSLAPYFSEVLANHLENGIPLNNEVDLNRYKSLYWKSA